MLSRWSSWPGLRGHDVRRLSELLKLSSSRALSRRGQNVTENRYVYQV
jgi:hypothetical protein